MGNYYLAGIPKLFFHRWQLRRQSAEREAQISTTALLFTQQTIFVIVCMVQTHGTLAMQAEQSRLACTQARQVRY